jgi:hypothetical protein
MVKPAPKIDDRTATEIATTVRSQLEQYTRQHFSNSTTADGKIPLPGNAAALVNIFARYCEIIIQRLNQVPNKNFLAFLDLLGASRLPPQPARVPLTFTLAAGSAVDAIVPARTQVAAPPPPGESEPVIFETERELVVSAVQLAHIFVRDPRTDRFADLRQLARSEATAPLSIWDGNESIEHILYIGESTFLGYPDLQSFTLKFELQPITLPAGQQLDSQTVQWEIWDGDRGIPFIPQSEHPSRADATKPIIIRDSTEKLTRNGDGSSGSIIFANLPGVPPQEIAGSINRWLRCRLQTRITKSATAQPRMVRQEHLPKIKKITFQATVGKTNQVIAAAFTNQFVIDLSKPFYPFGEKPKFGDILYLGSREAFSKEGADITLQFDLADLEGLGLALPRAINKAEIKVDLIWEIWTRQGWFLLGTSNQNGPIDEYKPPSVKFQDLTKAFTEVGSENKTVKFRLPQDPDPELQPVTINGIESFWVRVRISNGNYGKEGGYKENRENPSGFQFDFPTFRPPLIKSLKVSYRLVTADKVPEHIVTYNDFTYQHIPTNQEVLPFKPIDSISPSVITRPLPTLHFGFSLPVNRKTFPNRTLSLYFKLAESLYIPRTSGTPTATPIGLIWEYWHSQTNRWETLRPQDDTKSLTHEGLVEFLPSTSFAAKIDFNLQQPCYWLRVRWQLPDNQLNSEVPLPSAPKLSRILLNTMLATQTVTVEDEILGSSNGSSQQVFSINQTPILPGQQLVVREVEEPSAIDRPTIGREEGRDAISITRDLTGRPQEIWVRWHEVPDFYGSGSRDRHYVLDHLTGELRFGNGINGKIPPPGTGNLRMAQYRTGGGIRGNCPEGQIVQLKTTIPYIDSVTNPSAAMGGADAESIESLLDRAPRQIRHGDRAVTLEDYEDLAIVASPAVARAKCFPLLNLNQAPFDIQTSIEQPPKAIGTVSVMIVPRSNETKPVPSLELIDRVQTCLETHSIPTAKIAVVGPLYIRVEVVARIAVASLEGISHLEYAIQQTLTQFLHPLTGGPDKTGWVFGRTPHRSDFYALLESIAGVDHLRSLTVMREADPLPEDLPMTEQQKQQNTERHLNTKRFLVYSGTHTIKFESME